MASEVELFYPFSYGILCVFDHDMAIAVMDILVFV